MKLDAALPPTDLASVPAIARQAEKLGFDGLWSSETQHDPFLPGALIAEHTNHIQFGTAVAISFARSPTTLAYTAWDLAQASQGRFILGLGTQVKAHIERRFGMPWPDSVVAKLREQVDAIRALWHSWQNGEKLNYRGRYFKLTLMSPFFNPGPSKYPHIPIFIAGVNPGLARLAGEIADGYHVHPFHTREYLSRVIRPALEDGLGAAGRTGAALEVAGNVFVITDPQQEFMVRAQVAFYASTPSYRRVMQIHGWEDMAEELSALARRGAWEQMPDLIRPEILEQVAVRAAPADLAEVLIERYRGLLDRIALYLPYKPGEQDEFWASFRAGWERKKNEPGL